MARRPPRWTAAVIAALEQVIVALETIEQDEAAASLPPRQRSDDKPASAPKNEKLAYSINEIVRMCSIGRTTVYVEISDGRLRTTKIGTRTVITHADLMAWLDAMRQPPRDE